MSARDAAAREGRSLGRYLFGSEPTAAVLAEYASARAQRLIGEPRDLLDRLLVRWASTHPFLARGADLYARVVRPDAWVRRKLVCLLALAEVCGNEAPVYTPTVKGRLELLVVVSVVKGVATALSLAVGLPVLAGAHALVALQGSLGWPR